MNLWHDRFYPFGLVGVMTLAGWAVGLPGMAQPVPDGSLGAERSEVVGGGGNFGIVGGATRGANLFHSFQEFNVDNGGSVYFLNPAGIENILSRVTGNNPSAILGTLGVFGGNANLFLMNPNGIVFGPNARLDVQGSFVATTADAIGFGEQGVFSAIDPQVPPLLTVNPSAFFFNQIAAQPITQIGPPNQTNAAGYIEGLRVPDGRSLLLLGGQINIQDGRLRASGGRLELGGVARTGAVGLEINGNQLSLNFPRDLDRADISITGLADIDVTGGGGGGITMYARNLNILDGSDVCAGIGPSDNCGSQTSNFGTVGSQAGDIVLDAQGTIRAATTADRIRIENAVNVNAIGNAGDIIIQGSSLLLEGDSQVISVMEGQGNSGDVSIHVRDRLVLEGIDRRGAYLSTQTGGRGNAGDIRIRARDVRLSGASVIFSGISAGGIGRGGDIEIQSDSLSLTGGSQIGATVIRPGRDEQGNPRSGGRGAGGSIRLIVSDSIILSGTNPIAGFSSGIFAFTERGALGRGGEILIETDDLRIARGAVVGASTANRGNAGVITINVRDLEVIDGGQIVSATRNRGRAGGIRLHVTDSLSLSGIDPNFEERWERAERYVRISGTSEDPTNISDVGSVDDVVTSEGDASGIFTTANESSTGRGGTIALNTINLNLSDGAMISAQSAGRGRSGNINITMTGNLRMIDGDILASAQESAGGRIRIAAADIFLNGTSNIRTDVSRGGENAGSIDITANAVYLRDDSNIRTNVGGQGTGGNITVNADFIVAFDDSDILAYSAGGSGGNITLPVFFGENYFEDDISNEGLTQAELEGLNRNGQVDINASGQISSGNILIPDTSFVQDSLADLPESAIDTESLIASSCVVRSQETEGRFIITGRGGLPERPGEVGRSVYATGEVRSIPESSEQSWQMGDPIVEPQGLYQLEDGRMVLSQECD
ncbi:two-partner secretion domain-containing protein [Egbenema bharatensis]|uniref:two-partner secretion domain-containing protein n=1 Tax=Egbenema bharatensis TaxID=3463334 RepID=UPI003A8948BA